MLRRATASILASKTLPARVQLVSRFLSGRPPLRRRIERPPGRKTVRPDDYVGAGKRTWQPSKSETCVGRTGAPLTEYANLAEAEDGARHARMRYGSSHLPYRCRQCKAYHLAPADRHTPSSACPCCVSVNGRAKESYRSQRDAQRRADILQQEQRVMCDVYACEHGYGWHLTRRYVYYGG